MNNRIMTSMLQNRSNLVVFFIMMLLCSVTSAQIQEGFLYNAKVSVQNMAVRSGPGLNYYATQSLPVGSVLEIYCELPTGWAAVRPPQGSFSWVRGKYMEVQSDGSGKITNDNVASGVGSVFEDRRDVVQIRMRKDERVEILQKTTIQSEDWYRISPPSGEFRWVNLKDILPDDPMRRTAEQNQRSQNPSMIAISAVPTTPADNLRPYPQNTVANSQPASTPPATGYSDVQFNQELSNIESGWSAMLHTAPSNWHSGELLQRAYNLKSQANTQDKLTRVNLVIARLEKANEMERMAGVPQPQNTGGYTASNSNFIQNSSGLSQTTTANTIPNEPIVIQEGALGSLPPPPDAQQLAQIVQRDMANLARADELEKQLRLDGIGILSQLPQGAMDRFPIRWALLDANGQIRYYVSPSLGVFFKGLEGRVVGVVGSREFLPNNDSHLHITVRQISPL